MNRMSFYDECKSEFESRWKKYYKDHKFYCFLEKIILPTTVITLISLTLLIALELLKQGFLLMGNSVMGNSVGFQIAKSILTGTSIIMTIISFVVILFYKATVKKLGVIKEINEIRRDVIENKLQEANITTKEELRDLIAYIEHEQQNVKKSNKVIVVFYLITVESISIFLPFYFDRVITTKPENQPNLILFVLSILFIAYLYITYIREFCENINSDYERYNLLIDKLYERLFK